MKKIIQYIICCLVGMVIINLMIYFTCYAENEQEYYYVIHNDGKNVEIEIGTEEILLNTEEINLDNLIFASDVVNMHVSFSEESLDDTALVAEVRQFLLEDGYARLSDESIATEDEKKAQEYARENKLNIWANYQDSDTEGDDEKEEDSGFMQWWNKCYNFVQNNKWQILELLIALGAIPVLFRFLRRKLYTRKIEIYLGGGISSGKSTLRHFLINPDISEEELLDQNPTQKVEKTRIVRDDNNSKLTLEAFVVDNPGNILNNILDEMNRGSRFRKYVLIIIIAPTRSNNISNDIDREYVEDQLQTIKKFWIPILKTESIPKPESVILFANKSDLFSDPSCLDRVFGEHRRLLEKACKEIKKPQIIYFEYIRGSIVKRRGLNRIKEVLLKKSS